MSIEIYPSIAKIKRNGVYENLPGFVPETGSIATQQMIATSESSATAQHVHNKGEYFRLNDTLYQAIVKINAGDAIVVGTNCEVAVLGNDVTHIANSIAKYELGIATESHAIGEYFMVGETLYAATDNIQVGDNISTSTNCRLAVVGDELSGLKTTLIDYNRYDILRDFAKYESRTNNGITFSWNNGECSISGTSTGTLAASRFYYDTTALPNVIKAGEKYYLTLKWSREDPEAFIRIYFYDTNGTIIANTSYTKYSSEIDVPSDAHGMIMRVEVPKNTAVSGTLKLLQVALLTKPSVEALQNYSVDTRNAITTYANYQMKADGLFPLVWFEGGVANTGAEVHYTPETSVCTDYIPLNPNTTFSYNKLEPTNTLKIVEYNSSKEFISYSTLRAAKNCYTIGANTYYIRLSYSPVSSSGLSSITKEYAYQHFWAYFTDGLNKINIPLGLHTMPKNEGVLNCIKRARQMTDIKWKIAASIDRVNAISGQSYSDTTEYFQNEFDADREYVGLPYSSKNLMCTRRGIDQFITGAANANSNECTQSVYAGDRSVASYTGTVCITLTSYALHAPQIPSTSYTNMAGLTKKYDLVTDGTPHDINDLELCDILWTSSHAAIITDIERDKSGNVAYIEVSESTKFGSYIKDNSNGDFGGKCRRKRWTKEEFLTWFSSFAVYKYPDELLAIIPYAPNKYVPMEDETPTIANPYLPCVPVDGDKVYHWASSAGTSPVTVLINESWYSYLRVKKNGENFALVDVTGLTQVDVTSTANEEAVYEAYLCNISDDAETNKSYPCYWMEVASSHDATIHDNGDGSYTFSVQRDADNGYPFVVYFNSSSPNDGMFTQLLGYEKEQLQNGNWKYTFTATPPSSVSTITKIAVLFDFGDYGWVTSSALTPTVV